MSRHATLFGLDISYLAPHATQEMKALLSFVAKVAADFKLLIRGINMTNYYNSGLYMESFFTQYRHLCLDFDHILEEMLTCSYGLFQKYYSRDLDYKDDDDLKEQICNLFIDDIACYSLYFQPQIFDEETALECSLTPFTHDGLSLLALSGWGADLSPKLDAYQGLTHKTIDENSCLFSDFDYFQGLLGKTLTQKVLQAISYNK